MTSLASSIAFDHRFVDERQADIRSVVWGRQHLHLMDEIHKSIAEHGASAARRVCRVFRKGRIALPDSIFDQVMSALNENESRDTNAMRVVETMQPYYASLSPGQDYATAVIWGHPSFNGLSQTIMACMLHELAHADRGGPEK